MRHNKTINHLGRQASHRKAMMANMAASLIMHKRIKTTVAKAKALRMYVEPLITKSKDDSTHSRRMVFSYLKNKEAVAELFREIAPKIMERPGGYTRVLKTGFRQGDAAEMCFIELVDFNGEYSMNDGGKAAAASKKSRTRRAGSGTAAPKTEVSQTAAPEAEEPQAEEPQAEVPQTEVSQTAAPQAEETPAPDPIEAEEGEVETSDAEISTEEVAPEVPAVNEEPAKEEA